MSTQLRLGFPEHALGFDEMCISSSNEAAISVIRNIQRWPSPAICLMGPVLSGLTTATRAWAKEVGAALIEPASFNDLDHSDVEALAAHHSAIDDADQITNTDNLLSLINLSETKRTSILLTSHVSPASWPTRSNADLRSRLEAMPIAALDEPDEVLLTERLISACRQRYARLPRNAAEYLAKRMERSFLAIEDLAERLDAAVSEPGTKLTIKTARDVLNEGAGTHPLFNDDTS